VVKMNTRKMNTRITIFEKIGEQNEDGEVIDGIRKDAPDLLCEIGVGMYRYIDVLPAVVAGKMPQGTKSIVVVHPSIDNISYHVLQ